jgi:hypothetical protein
MDHGNEQRYEKRLSYRWPIWFGEDAAEAVYPALMEDISSGGIAFAHSAGHCRLHEGQQLMVRFSIPRFDEPDSGATVVGVTRTGRVRWIGLADGGVCRVGLQFDTPLSLKPAEEAALAALCTGAGP